MSSWVVSRMGVGALCGYVGESLVFGSQIRREYPPNLSILLSGGKETN